MLSQALQSSIETIYADNAFMKLCGLQISSLEFGEAKVTLHLEDKLHTNTNHRAHGGLLMAMMDTATGLAGCTAGKKLVTVSCSFSFVKSAQPGDELEATAIIGQHEKDVYHLHTEVINKETRALLALGKSEMLAISSIPDYPSQ